jgi:hypothetical protein
MNCQYILEGIVCLSSLKLNFHGILNSTQANYLKLCGTISETPAELQTEVGPWESTSEITSTMISLI